MTDISNHDTCQGCRGLCCSRFMLTVELDEAGQPKWDKTHAEGQDKEFFKTNFVLIRQHGDYAAPSYYGQGTVDLWFTCKQHQNGRCAAYDSRPQLCRTYLCEPAERHGVNPELYVTRDPDGKLRYPYTFPAVYDLEVGQDREYRPITLDRDRARNEMQKVSDWINNAVDELLPRAMNRAHIQRPLDQIIEYLKEQQAAVDKANSAKYNNAVRVLEGMTQSKVEEAV